MGWMYRLECAPEKVVTAYQRATSGKTPHDFHSIEALVATAWCFYMIQACFMQSTKFYPVTGWMARFGRYWTGLALARGLLWVFTGWAPIPGALLVLAIGFLPSFMAESGLCDHCERQYPSVSIDVIAVSNRYTKGQVKTTTHCDRCGYHHEKLVRTGKKDRHGIRGPDELIYEKATRPEPEPSASEEPPKPAEPEKK